MRPGRRRQVNVLRRNCVRKTVPPLDGQLVAVRAALQACFCLPRGHERNISSVQRRMELEAVREKQRTLQINHRCRDGQRK